jgi:hypothetical protein
MSDIFVKLMTEPQAVRRAVRHTIRKLGLGSTLFRYKIGAVERPAYAFLVYQAAKLAHRLGHERVSVVEFGVAGGGGLLAMERHADWVETIFPVKIEVYGFDTGGGLPELGDYRDLKYHWKPGFFRMDQEALKKRLTRANLVLGDVRQTIGSFLDQYKPAPIGGVSHDFDFYSSTMSGLTLFDAEPRYLLPRIVCYMDDVIGSDVELYNDFTGERAAVHDFNATHADKKLSPLYYLTATNGLEAWHHQIWSFHHFSHPDYDRFVSEADQQLPIEG